LELYHETVGVVEGGFDALFGVQLKYKSRVASAAKVGSCAYCAVLAHLRAVCSVLLADSSFLVPDVVRTAGKTIALVETDPFASSHRRGDQLAGGHSIDDHLRVPVGAFLAHVETVWLALLAELVCAPD
jgi:hypothetical protein